MSLTALALLLLPTPLPAVQTPCPEGVIRPLSQAPGDRFGHGITLAGNQVAIGSSADHSISVYERDGQNWFLTDLLRSPGAGAGNLFGNSLSHASNVLVSSAPSEPSMNRGRVHVFGKQGGAWTLEQTLAASNEANFAAFGASADTNGVVLAAGATGVPVSGQTPLGQGAVYLFTNSLSGWVESEILVASDAGNGDNFGAALAMANSFLFVGTPHDDDGTFDSGSVYVFEDNGSGYAEVQKLVGSNVVDGSNFGDTLASDGTTLLVGAPGHSNGGNIADGAVFVFEFQAGAWTEVAKLRASDGASFDRFGASVAVSGSTALIAATEREDAEGAVYLFKKGTGGWVEDSILEPSHGQNSGRFGSVVAILGDSIVVSAPGTKEGGTVETYSMTIANCRTLSAFPDEVSISNGGAQIMTLDAGLAFAGAPYRLAASLSGTSPGFSRKGFRVPLNPDPFLSLSLKPNSAWSHNIGVLDGNGQATAWLNVPALNEPSIAGLIVNHTFAVLGAGSPTHIGNTTSLRLVQ